MPNPLYIVTVLLILLVLFSILRNKVLREIGFRNIFRRKSTTLLIIFGSLIGTALIAGSLTLGDSFAKSTRIKAENTLGEIDAQISVIDDKQNSFSRNVSGSNFTEETVKEVSSKLSPDKVDGIMPVLIFGTSLIKGEDPKTSLSATNVEMISFQNGKFNDENINFNIAYGETIVSEDIAKRLDLKIGDEIKSFNEDKNFKLKVAGINTQKGASAFSLNIGNIIVSREFLEKEFELPKNSFNRIFVSAKGSAFETAYDGEVFEQYLTSQLRNDQSKFQVRELKSQYTTGGLKIISYIFLVVSLAGVAAGILLIINIYTMLAEERKSEMGTLRAIAFTRKNLIKTFIYEAFVYSIVSSFVGVIVGVGVGFVLLTSITNLTSQFDVNLNIVFDSTTGTWFGSFCLGLLITFITSSFASYKISKLNIVSAIRGIPDEKNLTATTWDVVKLGLQGLMLINGVISIILGVVLLLLPKDTLKEFDKIMPVDAFAGYNIFFGLFFTCYFLSLMIGKFLSLKGKEKYNRFVITGLNLPPLLLALFLDKIPFFNKIFETALGSTILLIAGLTIVFCTTTIVTYNLDLVVLLIEKIIGKLSSTSSVIKLSIRYASENKFRTGLTILMFSMVLFLVGFLSVYRLTINQQLESFLPKEGYDANVSVPKKINADEIKNKVEKIGITENIEVNESLTIAFQDFSIKDLYPEFSDDENKESQFQFDIFGLSPDYIKNNEVKLSSRLDAYKSDKDLLDDLVKKDNYIILSPFAVGNNPKFADQFKTGNKLKVKVDDKVVEVTIAGVMDQSSPANINLFQYGALTSDKLINNFLNEKSKSQSVISFKLKKDVSKSEGLKSIQKVLIEYNLSDQLFSIAIIFDIVSKVIQGAVLILQGFLSFSLFVGIAGIAIIMTRSVHERRQQIGMLRSLGFQRKSILFTFFLEASFIILLGVIIGIVSGCVSASIFINALNNVDSEKATLAIPYGELIVISIAVYIVSIIFTLLPSYKASKLSPVEATNYLD